MSKTKIKMPHTIFFLLEQCMFETHLELEKQRVKGSKKKFIQLH